MKRLNPDRASAPSRDGRGDIAAAIAQVADAVNTKEHERQAEALQVAREAIENLDGSVTLLQLALAQQESEAAAAKYARAQAEQERDAMRARLEQERNAQQAELQQERRALQLQLEKAGAETARAREQALHLQTAFTGREAALTTARDRLAAAEGELSGERAERQRLAAALESAQQAQAAALAAQAAHYESRLAALETTLAQREQQIAALTAENAALASHRDSLAETAATLQAAQNHAQETVRSQAENIRFLETVLRVEREDTGRKSTALAAELARERKERGAVERVSASLRKDVALLLSRLPGTARAAG